MINTVLARSTELKPRGDFFTGLGSEFLQDNLLNRYFNVSGMYAKPPEEPPQALTDTLEDLFHNITLSLLSSSALQWALETAMTRHVCGKILTVDDFQT